MADEIVLSFQDSLLRKSDIKLLEEGQWLNDKIIGFMFEYFEYILFNKMENVLFVNPDVAQYIKLCKGADLATFLEPLSLHSKVTIFVPVNSNINPEATGGSHWSLLVYDSHQYKFRHYDSCAPSNHVDARQMSKSIEPFLRGKQKVNFVEELCPQQQNSYDCGMYVISITETLCNRLQDQVSFEQDLKNEVTPEYVKRKRTKIKNIIEEIKDTCSS